MRFTLQLLASPFRLSTRGRILVMVASVSAAVAIRWSLDSWLGGQSPYLLIVPAVALTAWVGGVWVGLGATALGTVLSLWLFVQPRESLAVHSTQEVIFVGSKLFQGGVISAFFWAMHRALSRRQSARRKAAAEFEKMADQAPNFVWASASDDAESFVNRSWRLFTGVDLGAAAPDRLSRLHPGDLERVEKLMEEAKAARSPYQVEYRLRRADGAYRWISEHAVPRYGDEGIFEGFIGSSVDITPARQESEELRFLAELQGTLATTLDLDKTTEALARVLAPDLADWCFIYLRNEKTGALTAARVFHSDPENMRRSEALFLRPVLLGPEGSVGFTSVLGRGEPCLTRRVDDAFLRAVAETEEEGERLRALGLVSCLAVPLRVRGRVIGVLSLATAESGRELGEDTLRLIEKIGGMAAFALENATLHRTLGEALAAEAKAREAMEVSESRFRFAWEADLFGMCVLSRAGEVREANDAFLRLYGYTREDLEGGRVKLTSRMGDREARFGTFIWEHLDSSVHCEPFGKTCITADGRQVPVLVVGCILPDDEGCLVFMLDLTARRVAEAELERQRGQLKTIIDAVPAMVAYIGPDERFVIHNRQYERWMGLTHSDIHGKTVRELLGEARYPEAEPHLYAALAGNNVRYEKTIHGPGKYRDAMVTYHPDPGPDGRVRGVVIHAYDITESRRMAVAVQRSERRYRTLITATASIVWTADGDGRVTEANGWQAFTGLEVGDDLHERWLEAIHPEDRPRIASEWAAAVRTRSTWDAMHRLKFAGGGYRHVQSRAVVIVSPDGNSEEWIGTVTDVHQRVEAEESLRRKEAELKLIIDAMPALVARVDRDRRYVLANQSYQHWYGIDPDSLRGKRVEEVVGAEVYAELGPQIDRVMAGAEVSYEGPMRYRLGPPRWVSAKLTPHLSEQGEVLGYFALVLDISERKESERRVGELFQRYRFLADAMPQNVWTTDAAGQQDYVNRRWADYTGRETHAGQVDWTLILHPEELEETTRRWQLAVNTGDDYLMEHRLRDAQGEYHWFLSLAKARRDDSGNVVQWVGTSTNIDRQRTAYAQLAAARADLRRHADTLEAEVRQRTARLEELNGELEAFTYSASHDLRVPLQHIHSFAEAVMEEEHTRMSPASLENLRLVLNSASRMDALINDLLAYSRISRAEVRLQEISLEAAVAQVLNDYRANIVGGGALVTVERPLPEVRADPVGLQQALTNLLGNALKFVTPGRRPEVVVRAERREERVRLWIEDKGIGIEPRQHEAIFEIFRRLHTTREYAGTGVGLSLVRKGMARMGGACGVESTLGEGSRFWLEFAESAGGVDEPPPSGQARDAVAG